MALPLVAGCFVEVEGLDRGVGKLLGVSGPTARVEWFTSVARHRQEPRIESYPKARVRRSGISPQTRCYVSDEWGDNWQMGRVLGVWGGNSELQIEVRIGGGDTQLYPEAQVWARCLLGGADPVETLIHRVQETPYFYERRRALRRSLVRQRALSHGLTGLLSSRVLLLPHQAEIVRRVLEDPVQRYLLADEVGLGKTIEAGAIIRQLRLDEPQTPVLVVVPQALRAQWRQELEEKLCLPVDGSPLRVLSVDELAAEEPGRGYGLVVMDEAHHIASAHRTRPELWERARALAHKSPRLLLLSATPALNHEADFLAMLHLLEPQSYPLENVDGFRRLVANRQPIGEFLMRFTLGVNRFRARGAVSSLRELFPHDEAIAQGADALEAMREADEWPQGQADVLVRDLRLRISESYRLHRRLLRTARAQVSLPPQVLAPRAEDDDADVVTEWSEDERISGVYQALSSWREAAAGTLWTLPDGEREAQAAPLAEVAALLMQLSASWLDSLQAAVACRLSLVEGAAGTQISEAVREACKYLDEGTVRLLLNVPLFEGEDAYLQALLDVLEGEAGEDAIDTLGAILRRMARRAVQKVVVFTSFAPTSRAIADRLRGQVGVPLYVHEVGNQSEVLENPSRASERGLEKFREEPGGAVLVCNRSGEEGLNLQFADVAWHFDLPWEPNRLEQRMGRLDRIGHGAPLRSRVLVGYSGTDDIGEESLHEAWFAVLDEGFGLFAGSVADLQLYTDAKMPLLKRAALLEGASGLRAQIAGMKAEIEAERQKLTEQNWLDNLEAVETGVDTFFGDFISLDAEAPAIEEALEGWVVEVLKFRRSSPSPGVVLYKTTDRTLLPQEWTQRLEASQKTLRSAGGLGAYSRSIACAGSPKQLLRLGAPFVDLLHSLLLWDDRGQSYAMWRTVDG